jgi:hypothetical protein
MKKYIVCLAVLLGLSIPSFGGNLKIMGYERNANGDFSWSNYDVVFGFCSYREVSGRLDNISYTAPASYFQIPLMQYGANRVNMGIVCPFFDTRRTRPEFSISHLLGEDFGLPSWMPLEIGGYWAASPWGVFGGQLGLLRIKF